MSPKFNEFINRYKNIYKIQNSSSTEKQKQTAVDSAKKNCNKYTQIL